MPGDSSGRGGGSGSEAPRRGSGGQLLAGVGVAFKLVCAMDGDAGRMLDRYGDLVAAGTVADVMPLAGENRFIIRYGLQKMAAGTCRPGFTALLEETGAADKRPTAATIGFSLAPRINAAGRLGETEAAVELLMTEDRRRASGAGAGAVPEESGTAGTGDAHLGPGQRDAGPGTAPGPYRPGGGGLASGVIGIVASRLTDAFSVPAVMICLDGETGKGSCRSTGGFNLYEALTECAGCLEGFGGHAMAAGLTVRRDRVEELRRQLRRYYREHPAQGGRLWRRTCWCPIRCCWTWPTWNRWIGWNPAGMPTPGRCCTWRPRWWTPLRRSAADGICD